MIYNYIITTFYACEKFAQYGYMMKTTENSDVYGYGTVVLGVLTGKNQLIQQYQMDFALFTG